jgi:Domain of unknown function (DUF222)
MGHQPDPNAGPAGDPEPEPHASPSGGSTREALLAGFDRGGTWDTRAPGPELAVALAAVAGTDWRCKGASGEQVIGILGRIAALESWMAAGKLGLIRTLIRDDDPAFLCGSRHGDLPDLWERALAAEIALALAASVPSADKTMRAAWELGARLPEINTLLETGILDAPKARVIAEVFAELSDEDAGRAEALIVPELREPPAKTYAQVEKIATEIALIVDPRSGERRRKAAEKHAARVIMFRERAGTAAICGRDLPPDQTLAAHANVCARADEYKQSAAFAAIQMDQLRAQAYLDLLNGVTAEERIAHGLLTQQDPAGDQAAADTGPGPDAGPRPADEPRPGGGDCPCDECDGSCLPDDDSPDDDSPDDDRGDDGPDDDNPGDGDRGGPGNGPGPGGGPDDNLGKNGPGSDQNAGGAGGNTPGPGSEPPEPPSLSGGPADPPPVLQDLVLPLATLLGLADRPGEGHGLGALDPDLCRALAATAAHSPHTTICLTITGPDGVAIGHGCGRPGKPTTPTSTPGGPAPPLVALPARINLTAAAGRLAELTGHSQTGWALAPRGTPNPPGPPGDPDWCGTWALTMPGGRQFIARLEPVPTYECDHRLESHAYQPNDRLRHLVQVRDYTCTFPTCNRHARDSDFEHAIPYDKGGRTCACNAGARSRQCHRVKQSPGWTLTQPRPGWHQWQTPRGRTYTQGPKRYPV